VLPPERPAALRVENVGGGLEVSFRAPEGRHPATGYRIQVSKNGDGFDDGVAISGTSTVLDGLPAGAVRFVRVVATNDGGESQPTEVVGARVASNGEASVLVVGGFDRLDGLQAVEESVGGLGAIDRVYTDRMNDGSYAVRH